MKSTRQVTPAYSGVHLGTVLETGGWNPPKTADRLAVLPAWDGAGFPGFRFRHLPDANVPLRGTLGTKTVLDQ